MRAALQRVFGQADSGEDALHRLDVAWLASMRGGHHRKFSVAETEMLRPARLNQWQQLERLRRRQPQRADA